MTLAFLFPGEKNRNGKTDNRGEKLERSGIQQTLQGVLRGMKIVAGHAKNGKSNGGDQSNQGKKYAHTQQ